MIKYKYSQKEKIFCSQYIVNWNQTQSYLTAYPNTSSPNVAAASANRMLKKPKIVAYIKEIQKDLEKQAGISRLSQLLEFKKIAYSSISHLHNNWVERKDFDLLTKDQKDCIESIDTKVIKRQIGDEKIEETTEFVKIKLYDKQKALENINKMLGYNEPDSIITNQNITVEDKINKIKKINFKDTTIPEDEI